MGFATPALLEYSGGSQTVAHIMDWREMAARPAVNTGGGGGAWKKLRGAWAGGKKVSQGAEEGKDGDGDGDKGHDGEEHAEQAWDLGVDDRRGWVIGFSWLLASAVE